MFLLYSHRSSTTVTTRKNVEWVTEDGGNLKTVRLERWEVNVQFVPNLSHRFPGKIDENNRWLISEPTIEGNYSSSTSNFVRLSYKKTQGDRENYPGTWLGIKELSKNTRRWMIGPSNRICILSVVNMCRPLLYLTF